tara:strand:- start:9793 stop:9915 length:123 start_codon:yes stop_codon:yes gene_type:complete
MEVLKLSQNQLVMATGDANHDAMVWQCWFPVLFGLEEGEL